MTTAISPGERLQALIRHLTTVASRAEEATKDGGEARFDSVTGNILLNSTESSMVLNVLGDGQPSEDKQPALLLAQTAAVCLKATEELEDYRTVSQIDPELERRIRENLDLDLSICKSLVEELGDVIEEAVAEGDRSRAVRFGELRLAVRQQIAVLRRVLDGRGPIPDGDHETASSAAEAAGLEIPPEDATADERFERSLKHYEKLKRKWLSEEREKKKWRKLRVLLWMVGVGAATAAISLAVQLLPVFDLQTAPVLEISDFEHIPVVASIEAHPPSLFVRVHSVHWQRLTYQRKLEVVRQIGSVLYRAGYNGARIRTEDGTLVGEWIREVGTYAYPKPTPRPR